MKVMVVFVIMISCIYGCNTYSISEIEKAEIIAELEHINKIDQQYAGLPPQELFDRHGHEKAWDIFQSQGDSVALLNQTKIKRLYNKYGYLGYKEIGEAASGNFWISIQHADNDVAFQRKMLEAMKKEIAKDNASKLEYAMLEDRVNINLNKKQRFGSQVTYNTFGQAIPKNGLLDSLNIEQIRAEYDMPPFIEYYNNMTINHFEMNKAGFFERGIMEPKLYK